MVEKGSKIMRQLASIKRIGSLDPIEGKDRIELATCQIVPQPTKGKAMQELKGFYEDRMVKHREYYQKNQVIQSAYDFTKKIVDKLAEECIYL